MAASNSRVQYVFPPPRCVALAVASSSRRFPVRRVYCIGVNYRRPATPGRGPRIAEGRLIVFHKHPDAIVGDGADIPFPPGTQALSYEVEMVVAIGTPGHFIAETRALDHVFGYAVGADLTRTDLMLDALANGGPVDVAKAFDCSAPCGPIHPTALVGHPATASLWLRVDGETRQEGNIDAMLQRPAALISELSRLFTLKAGDLIYTGTPAPPADVRRGQTVACGIDGLGTITNRVT